MSKKQPKIVQVHTQWDSLESIKAAERQKAKLENAGYSLINQFGGLFHSVLVYQLK